MLRNLIRFLSAPIGMMTALVLMTGLTFGFYKVVLHKSPGPLTAVHIKNEPLGGYASHSEFEQECSHCHAPIHCIEDNRCQECHMDIAEQRSAAVGLHGLLPGTSQCQSCHIEHQGRDAHITTFAFNNIDHIELASFSLENHKTDYAGNDMACDSCHQLGHFGAESLDCTNCHASEDAAFITSHTNQYGSDCISCHDGHDRLANFDHNEFFVLSGQHTSANCESCHVNQVFGGTPCECVACHEQPDVHDQEFGQDCLRCHTATAWLPAELRYHTFPLEHGSEGQQECQVCHPDTYTQYPCYTCHDAAETKVTHAEERDLETYENCLECHPTGESQEAINIQASTSGDAGMVMKTDQLPVNAGK